MRCVVYRFWQILKAFGHQNRYDRMQWKESSGPWEQSNFESRWRLVDEVEGPGREEGFRRRLEWADPVRQQ